MQKSMLHASRAAMLVAFAVCLTAYAEDGYIESEGDAYVSLGHCAGPNTKMEVDFQLTEVEYNTKPFGSWGDRLSIPMFSLYISYVSDKTDLRFSWDCTDVDGQRQALNFDKADLKRHIISFDAPNRTYASTNVTDGGAAYTYKFSKAVSGSTSPYPLAVFARGADKPATRASNDFGGPTKMKVYGVKIYESGDLVKTYTPCLKGGIPGLKVTGPGVDTFVTGINITKVKYGGDILVEKDDPYISTGDYNSATKAAAGAHPRIVHPRNARRPPCRPTLRPTRISAVPAAWRCGSQPSLWLLLPHMPTEVYMPPPAMPHRRKSSRPHVGPSRRLRAAMPPPAGQAFPPNSI